MIFVIFSVDVIQPWRCIHNVPIITDVFIILMICCLCACLIIMSVWWSVSNVFCYMLTSDKMAVNRAKKRCFSWLLFTNYWSCGMWWFHSAELQINTGGNYWIMFQWQFSCFCRPTASANAIMLSGGPSAAFLRYSARSSGQILLPWYLRNGLSNLDEIFTGPYWWPD